MAVVRVLAVLLLIGFGSACRSGRLYFGSLNASHASHISRTGIYVRQGSDFNRHPLYRQETGDEYLYFISGSLVGGHWVIGPSPGSLQAHISVSSLVASPELVRGGWFVWDTADELWVSVPRLKATCVSRHFMTCHSGVVTVDGLDRSNHMQEPRMGDYVITNRLSDMRPVYRKRGTEGNFLYHKRGFWLVGPRPGEFTVGLMVQDSAWRPEHITSHWVVFTGTRLERRAGVKVLCKGLSSDDRSCTDDTCQNEATCTVSEETSSLLCACQPGYVGNRCQNEIHCGMAPEIPNGHIVGSTGSTHLDMVFYGCSGNMKLQGQPGSVCLSNSTWSNPPQCVLDTNSGGHTPVLPDAWMPGYVRRPNTDTGIPSLPRLLDELSQ